MRAKKPMSPWPTYEAAMRSARAAAFALADAIERYLRKGINSFPGVAFQNACDAANAYAQAVRVAAPYHFATIHPWDCTAIINFDADELLDLMRELRGTALSVTGVGADGRKIAAYRYADDGIAGFYDVELRSMRRYGSPRREPHVVAASLPR